MFMWAPLHQKKTKKRKTTETSAAGPPPPQQPSSLWDEDGLLLCVQISNFSQRTTSFLRFKIANDTLNHLIRLAETDYYSGGLNRYVRHSHNIGCDSTRFSEYSLNPQLNGPFPSQLSFDSPTNPIGSVVYGLEGGFCMLLNPSHPNYNPHCHAIHYCDFAHWHPRWKITPLLPYHPIAPVTVTVDKQVYIFHHLGEVMDEDDTTGRELLCFVFDPKDESCKDVPFCAFHSLGVNNLVVASLGQKLLLLDNRTKTQYSYDIENSTWIPLDIDGRLLDHFSKFITQPISVPAHNTIYWIDKKGRIRAFDWVNLKMFVGAVVGFAHECDLREAYKYSPKLVHLKGDLFCLVWNERNLWNEHLRRLHLTVLRVCLYNTCDKPSHSPHHLAAFVVACSCYHLEYDSPSYMIKAAYLL